MLLHGLLSSVERWRPVVERFEAKGRRVVTLTTPGHDGRPFLSPTLDVAMLADDAASQLLEQAVGPAILVGHSMGGLIAQELAVRAPESVAALVLEDPAWVEESSAPKILDLEGRPRWLAAALPAAAATAGVDPALGAARHNWLGRAWPDLQLGVPVTLFTATGPGAVVKPEQVARARAANSQGFTHRQFETGHSILDESPAAYLDALEAACEKLADTAKARSENVPDLAFYSVRSKGFEPPTF